MTTKTNNKKKASSKKQQKEKLINELCEAENLLAHLEFSVIPKLIEQLRELGITQKEIEENNLEDTIDLYGNYFYKVFTILSILCVESLSYENTQ